MTLVRSAACVEGFKGREEVDRASSRKTDPIGTDEAASDSQLRRGGVSGSSQSLPRGSLFLTAGRRQEGRTDGSVLQRLQCLRILDGSFVFFRSLFVAFNMYTTRF